MNIKYYYYIENIMNTIEKYNLITRNLKEVLNSDNIFNILKEKPLKVYWGTAPTSKIHIGYIYQMLKIRDLVLANCEVIILIADLHAFLDNKKSNLDNIENRTKYYIKIICSLLKLLNVDLSKIKFVKGLDFQLNKKYTLDVYKLASITTANQCKHAGSEVVKQSKDVQMTNLLYPCLQILDMVYLDCDAFLGGIDQRKINTFGIDMLKKIGYNKKYSYLMTKLISGISTKKQENELDDINNKMSSSINSSKIELLSSAEEIKKTINKAYCLEKDIKDNSLLKMIKDIIFNMTNELIINNKIYTNYEDLENDFINNLHPKDLKDGLSNFLIKYLKPLRDEFDNKENKELLNKAYLNLH